MSSSSPVPNNWAEGRGRHPRNAFFQRVRNDRAPEGKEIVTHPGTYWLQCLACIEAYDAGLTSKEPQTIGGNCKNLDRHLVSCPFFDTSKFIWKSTAPTKTERDRNKDVANGGTVAGGSLAVGKAFEVSSPVKTEGGKRDGGKNKGHPRNNYFQRVRNDDAEPGKEEKPQAGTYWTQCTSCIRAYVGGLTNQAPLILIGNSKTLDRHLKNCQFFDKSNFTWKTTAKSRAKSHLQSVPSPQPVSRESIGQEEGGIEDRDPQQFAAKWKHEDVGDSSKNEGAPRKRKGDSALATPAKKKMASPIGHYLHRTPALEETEKFHNDLVDVVAENNLDCRLIESFSFQKMIMHLRPDIYSHCLPITTSQMECKMESRAHTSDTINLQSVSEHALQYKGILPGLSSYTFVDSNQNTLECLFASAGTASVIVSIEPTTADQHDGITLARGIEQQLQSAKAVFSGMQVGSFCTNDVGGYGKARRILSLRFPFILFTNDFSHQLNQLAKDVLTHCSVFAAEANEALLAVQFLMSSSEWMEKLRAIQKEIYVNGLEAKLSGPSYSDWTSLQACLASILRVRVACELVHIRHCQEENFPEQLACFGNGDFWSCVQSAHSIILPFVRTSLLVNAHGVTMSDVTYVFLAIFQALEGNPIAREQVENRWRQLETPLFILSFCLDPRYARYVKPFLVAQNKARSLFTVDDLSRAAAGYYAKLFLRKHEVKQIRKACKTYFNAIIAGDDGVFDLNDMESRHFSTFWQEQTGDLYILGILAKRFLSTLVHSPEAHSLSSKLGFRHLKTVRSEESSTRVRCKFACLFAEKESKKRGNQSLEGQAIVADFAELARLAEVSAEEKVDGNEEEEKQHASAASNDDGKQLIGTTGVPAVTEVGDFGYKLDTEMETSLKDTFMGNESATKSYPEFWCEEIAALSDVDVEEGGTFYTSSDVHNDASKNGVLEEAEPDGDSDAELESIVVPAGGDHHYLQSIVPTAAREARLAWMTDMNFMKDWDPSRTDAPLPDSNHGIPEEVIHELANYRSAKLKLENCLGHDVATSLFQNALKTNQDLSKSSLD